MKALFEIFGYIAGAPTIAGLILTAVTIFLTSDWRLSLTALLVQYILIGLALTRSLQVEVAMVKIFVGAVASFILYLTARRIQEQSGNRVLEQEGARLLGLQVSWKAGPLGLPLRLLVVILVILATLRVFSNYNFPVVPVDIAFVTLWLGGMGTVGLVLSGEPLRVAAALLTILGGFDLVYATFEPSLATVGFWSALILLAALAFSYLALAQDLGKRSGPGAPSPALTGPPERTAPDQIQPDAVQEAVEEPAP